MGVVCDERQEVGVVRQRLPPQNPPQRCPPGLMCRHPRQPPGWLAAVPPVETSAPRLLRPSQPSAEEGGGEGEKDIFISFKNHFLDTFRVSGT